ncbi:MAG TPA: nitroreductase family protein [candidate division Zixibacteria bacterium]|nr:nitroreductase family protein [candidate division Zixibacteria bacterium]
MLELAKSHRSIRSYTPQDIDDTLLNDLLLAGLRSSSAGNMQTWSVIVTRDEESKRHLYELHRKQRMVLEAPVLLTFCADVFRMREWIRVNNSKQSFDDFLGFLTGAVDAVIAAQTITLAAESVGLGICYLGTTWWAADKIIEMMELPKGVLPVTTLVVGYPAEDPALRDRLPLELIVHQEKYQRLTDQEILETHAEREKNAWARYNAVESVRKKLEKAGITRITDYYTSEFKYSKELHLEISKMLFEVLKEQGMWL